MPMFVVDSLQSLMPPWVNRAKLVPLEDEQGVDRSQQLPEPAGAASATVPSSTMPNALPIHEVQHQVQIIAFLHGFCNVIAMVKKSHHEEDDFGDLVFDLEEDASATRLSPATPKKTQPKRLKRLVHEQSVHGAGGPEDLDSCMRWRAMVLSSANLCVGLVLSWNFPGALTAELAMRMAMWTAGTTPAAGALVLYSSCDCSKLAKKVAGGHCKDMQPLHRFKDVLQRLPNEDRQTLEHLQELYLRRFYIVKTPPYRKTMGLPR